MKDDVKDLIGEKLTGDETFTDHWELYEHLDFDGSMHELIDSRIEMYNYPLRQWAVDNWEYIEEAISEGLTEGIGDDYHRLIQCGQFMQLCEEAREVVEELYAELDGKAFNVEVTA
jgi:hypothetical protein